MNCPIVILFVCCSVMVIRGTPIFITGSSPSGDAVIAISSDDPDIEKYLRFGFSKTGNSQDTVVTESKDFKNGGSKSIAISSRISSADGGASNTGRGFVSNSFNPFLLPFFFAPHNFQGFGLTNPSTWNWQEGVEGYYDPSIAGNGQITTVAAVNDNGRIYSNVKTGKIDNKGL